MASVYNLLLGVGFLAFPVVRSVVVKSLGFRLGMDVLSIVVSVNCCVYVLSTVGDWRK